MHSFRAKGGAFRSRTLGASRYMSRVSGRKLSFRTRPGFVRGARPGFTQIAAVVRGMGLRGETKAVDVPQGNMNFAAGNNAATMLNGTQEGAGFWNRIGRKIAMKSLQVTGNILPAAAGAPFSEELCRYIIFYDKQTNGVIPTWNQIVQNYDNAGGITNTGYDGVNLDNRDRFVILRDRKVSYPKTLATGVPAGPPYGTSQSTIGQDTGSDGGTIVKEFIKLNNMETQYNATANPATIAQINTGLLGIVFQGTVGGQYLMQLTTRVRFTDC